MVYSVMINLWMAKDPENNRVMLQSRSFDLSDSPPGRGHDWPIKIMQIEEDVFADILAAKFTHDKLEELWDAGINEGEVQ